MTVVFDRERVDALFTVLGKTAGRQMLETFADELPSETRTIAAFAAQRNLIETERHAHGLMGVAANFGAAQLQAALHELELAVRTHVAFPKLDMLIAEIEQVSKRTASAARTI